MSSGTMHTFTVSFRKELVPGNLGFLGQGLQVALGFLIDDAFQVILRREPKVPEERQNHISDHYISLE